MTRLSKWLLYIASFKWIYAFQIASIIISGVLGLERDIESGTTIYKMVLQIIHSKKIVLIVLLFLFIVAALLEKGFQKIKNNTRITYSIEGDAVFEVALSFIACIVSVLSITLNAYGLLLTSAIFFALGIIVDLSDRIYVLPIFFLKGYHIFKSNEVKIITKMSRDQYRLRMDDSSDGVEARELVKNTYIIF